MNTKPVPITAFINPSLRTAIKTIAAAQGITIRALIEAELKRVVNHAQTQHGNSNEIDKSLPAAR